MTTIYAVTNDQVLTATFLPKVACNNQNTVRLEVDFDSAWDGYAKAAIFYTSKNPSVYEKVLSSDNICIVPPEVLTESGHLFIGIKGVKGSEVKMTTALKYKIEVGAPMLVISSPTDDLYHQLLGELGKTNTAVKVERARIDNLAKLGEGSTTGDAELVDIRVDINGDTHGNAGSAVRRQISELHGVLSGEGMTLTANDFQQGTWSGGLYNNSSRIRCLLPISKGDVVSANPNGQDVSIVILADKTSTSGLDARAYTKEPFSWGCKYDGYIVFVVCVDSAQEVAMKPEDLTAQITIHRTAHGTANRGKMIYPVQYEMGNIYMSDSGFEYNGATTRVRTPQGYTLSLAKGDVIRLKDYNNTRFYVGWINPDGTYENKGWLTYDFICPVNAEYVILVCNTEDTQIESAETLGSLIEVQTSISNEFIKKSIAQMDRQNKEINRTAKVNRNIRSINHRGYNELAPENTLSAYKISKQMGFECVECDVQFTSDGVAVILHDGTVDRTSNGTGSINAMTFEQARSLDFGSWKSLKYAGEQIPRFDEFIALCKHLGLHPYIEVKAGTEAQIKDLVDVVKRHGMKGKVTWISFNAPYLGYIKAVDPKARLGYTVSSVDATTINTVTKTLQTGYNEVFINCAYNASAAAVQLCYGADIPLEVWTVNSESGVLAVDAYVSGITSDSLIAGNVFYENNIGG